MRKLIVSWLLAGFVKLHQMGHELWEKLMTEVKGVQYCVSDSKAKKPRSPLFIPFRYLPDISPHRFKSFLSVYVKGKVGAGGLDRASPVERFPIQNCIKGFYLNRKREN